MAPDADAGKASGNRSDPFAPLTSQLLPVGDSHEIYVGSHRWHPRSLSALRPFSKLGSADHGWLKAKHHFSFGSHYDPGNMG